jgi:ferredoxin
MAISKVWLDESADECISCGNCESICPDVFEVPEKMAVKNGVDFSKYEDSIKEAIDACPTGVIKAE